MNLRNPTTRVLLFAAALVLAPAASLRAQDPEDDSAPNPADLARQIRRNMLKIEEDLGKAGTHDAARGEQVKQDLDKLLQGMKSRQDQVIKDIDDIVKQFKSGNCNSGSCSSGSSGSKRDSNENQKQSKARDRNQSDQKSGKPREQNGEKPKPKPGKDSNTPEKKKGSAEDNGKDKEDQGLNQPGDPKDRPGPEKAAHLNLNEIWGNLPPELRQKLFDRNYDDFTPEYKSQIDEYFKRTGSIKKN